jgi:paraquat-inducible protein A
MRFANLALLILFPIAWTAPLMRAAVLPIFGMSDISVLSGIMALWQTDAALAILVAVLALAAPYAKVLILAAIQFGMIGPRALPALHLMGKLAMADVFLIALYVVIAKGAGYVTVQTAWGLYLFTACILASLLMSHLASPLKPSEIAGKTGA